MTAMRILVCGGRDFKDRSRLFSVLDGLHKKRGISCIIQGGCITGADAYAKEWAKSRNVEMEEYAADWKKYGRAAGPIRNALMAAESRAEGLIAFPGGSGTRNMIKCAKFVKIKIWQPLG